MIALALALIVLAPDSIDIPIRVHQPRDAVYMMLDSDPASIRRIGPAGQVRIPANTRELRFFHPWYRDFVVSRSELDGIGPEGIRVHMDLLGVDEFRYSEFYPIQNRANLYVETDEGNEVLVDGRSVGKGSIWLWVDRDTSRSGSIEIRSEKSGNRIIPLNWGEERSRRITWYALPDRQRALSKGIIPGLAQAYEGDRAKAWLFAGAAVTTGALLAYTQLRYDSSHDSYWSLRGRYFRAYTFSEAASLGDMVDARYAKAMRWYRYRNRAAFAFVSVWLVNQLDVRIPHPDGYRSIRIGPDPYFPASLQLEIGF